MKQRENDRKPNQGYTKTILLPQVVLEPQPLPGGVLFWGSTTARLSSSSIPLEAGADCGVGGPVVRQTTAFLHRLKEAKALKQDSSVPK